MVQALVQSILNGLEVHDVFRLEGRDLRGKEPGVFVVHAKDDFGVDALYGFTVQLFPDLVKTLIHKGQVDVELAAFGDDLLVWRCGKFVELIYVKVKRNAVFSSGEEEFHLGDEKSADDALIVGEEIAEIGNEYLALVHNLAQVEGLRESSQSFAAEDGGEDGRKAEVGHAPEDRAGGVLFPDGFVFGFPEMVNGNIVERIEALFSEFVEREDIGEIHEGDGETLSGADKGVDSELEDSIHLGSPARVVREAFEHRDDIAREFVHRIFVVGFKKVDWERKLFGFEIDYVIDPFGRNIVEKLTGRIMGIDERDALSLKNVLDGHDKGEGGFTGARLPDDVDAGVAKGVMDCNERTFADSREDGLIWHLADRDWVNAAVKKDLVHLFDAALKRRERSGFEEDSTQAADFYVRRDQKMISDSSLSVGSGAF